MRTGATSAAERRARRLRTDAECIMEEVERYESVICVKNNTESELGRNLIMMQSRASESVSVLSAEAAD